MWKFTCRRLRLVAAAGKSPSSSICKRLPPIFSSCRCSCYSTSNTPLPPPHHSKLLTRSEIKHILAVNRNTGFNRLEDAWDLFHGMLRFQPLPPAADFCRLLTGIVKMKKFTSAVLIYREMRVNGIPFDDYTMSLVINCFCHLKQVDFGFGVLSAIFKLGFKPDVVTLTTLIRGLFEANRCRESVQVFWTMVKQKVCDEITYGTVINGLCKSGNTSQAIQLLRLVEEQGSFKPNIVMYTTIIDSLCKDDKVDEALKHLSEMVAKVSVPDNVTYDSLIKSMKCEVVTFSTVVQGLFEAGRCDDARKVISIMQYRGVSPNNITYCIWVDGLCQNGLVSEAQSLICDLENNNVSVGIAAYNALIKGLLENGEISCAKNVLNKLPSLGLEPNVRTFNVMLNGFRQQGLLEDAQVLQAKMGEYGCSPNRCTHAIVQGRPHKRVKSSEQSGDGGYVKSWR